MKLRRIWITIIMILLLSLSVYADMGPKPSVNLKFRGFSEVEFYVTLLSEEESTGPHSWVGFGNVMDEPPSKDGDVWHKFVDYEDKDGFYFLQYFELAELKEDSKGPYYEFTWNYYPPERFKVLLYYPQVDVMVVCDEIMETYAFHSQYEVTCGEPGEGGLYIDRTYGYGWEVFAFLVRLGLTVALEVLVALAFGFKQKGQLQVILLANLVTQLALNFGLLTKEYPVFFFFYVVEYFIWEAMIFGAEALTYKLTLHRFEAPYQKKKRPVLYALTANVVSFVMGYVIWQWFPHVF